MIKRPIRFAALVLAISTATVSATAVFVMKKEAERDAFAIRELNRKIAAERQRISELRAEWGALDNPQRLQALVDRHAAVLRLQPIDGHQIATVRDVAAAIRQHRKEGEK
ncbi:hypothetical protein DLJ53_30775 [Acuticoccus sediminis]|uniref:Cell division protein FtsL n=1 Tax=Acuticoccus sediminis TaxID=2184697 RepID=A0A8B2NL51_9HYPH|nr:hypothetical protein [Acuticoccus sediminis]RAH97057.1 hypothetical protein DLJ53_30775 [Acuticoccus sediminis]